MIEGFQSELSLDGRERSYVAVATEFARRCIAPFAETWERERRHLPRDVFRAWADLGLLSLQVSTEAGGQGASFLCKVAVSEAMARTCLPSCFALINAQGSATRMQREGSPGQVRRYLPQLMTGELICAPSMSEPSVGSDFAAIATTATKISGGWALNGTKAWVTNGAHADLVVVYAQTEAGSGATGIASFIADLRGPGVSRQPAYDLIGGHAIGAAEIAFSDAFVSDEDLLVPAGAAFKRALKTVSAARTHVAAMACGVVANSLERAIEYAHQRRAFGRALIDHQGLRWTLADVATELEAARGLTNRAAQLIERGEDATLAAAQAKRYAGDMAVRSVSACMQTMGAIGLSADEPFGRHLISARISCYVDGTTEMQRDRIAALLGKHYGLENAGRVIADR